MSRIERFYEVELPQDGSSHYLSRRDPAMIEARQESKQRQEAVLVHKCQREVVAVFQDGRRVR